MAENIGRRIMYFTSIELENIKCFGENTILNLTDHDGRIAQWTMILGNNGVGKTTLLKSLCWMQPVEETDKEKKETAGIDKVAMKPLMDDFESELMYEELIKIGNINKSGICATLSYGVGFNEKPKEEQLLKFGLEFTNEQGKLLELYQKFAEIETFSSPVIFAYGASRHMSNKDAEDTELQNPTQNLLLDSGDLYDAEQILDMLDNASIRQSRVGKATDLLNKLKLILSELLPNVNKPENIIINSPINEDGSINKIIVEINTPDGKVKLNDLSLGYKTMLAWIVDLAVHMLWEYKESETPLEEAAIVIIDEIDLHLHPKWQISIRDILTKHFPRTQFICTAHSPIMAQDSQYENLAVVKRTDGEVIIENEPHIVAGWRIGQLLTSELFDFDSDRGYDNNKFIKRRRELNNKAKLSNVEEEELDFLNKKIDELPVGDTEEQDEAAKILANFALKLKAYKDGKNK